MVSVKQLFLPESSNRLPESKLCDDEKFLFSSSFSSILAPDEKVAWGAASQPHLPSGSGACSP